MSRSEHVLAIDQGTTSTRAIVFDSRARAVATAQRELPQIFPRPGWVEHDPEEIWRATLAVCRDALARAGLEAHAIAALGITNQRETAVLWERDSGRPLGNAIVWQDRRTADLCERLRRDGAEALVADRTGLIIDPYFSATKLAWMLDNIPQARARAEKGELAFGTIESFLLWRLTGGRRHASDATNACRTMLFDIHRQRWDEEILRLLGIPDALLPEVVDNCGDFGTTEPGLLGAALPVCGLAGDQQAATVGQACFAPGMTKSTYGTGCFALVNTGDKPVASRNRLLTTVAYRLDGVPAYAIEGSIFVAGAAVQWLRDKLGLLASAAATQALAASADPRSEVYMVPAFTGLGAPYWDPHARGALLGLTRDSGIPEIVRATLDAVCHQTCDLLEAMQADGASPKALRVDGGMVANDWLMQRLADLLGVPVERPSVTETTALGAGLLAGLQVGLFDSLDALSGLWRRDRLFEPSLDGGERERLRAGWRAAVARVRADQ